MSSLTCEILGTGWILASLCWREYFSLLICMCVCMGPVGVHMLTQDFLTSTQLPHLKMHGFPSHFPGFVPHPQGEVRGLKSELITNMSK